MEFRVLVLEAALLDGRPTHSLSGISPVRYEEIAKRLNALLQYIEAFATWGVKWNGLLCLRIGFGPLEIVGLLLASSTQPVGSLQKDTMGGTLAKAGRSRFERLVLL